jgi:hypothetical protein
MISFSVLKFCKLSWLQESSKEFLVTFEYLTKQLSISALAQLDKFSCVTGIKCCYEIDTSFQKKVLWKLTFMMHQNANYYVTLVALPQSDTIYSSICTFS